MEFSNINLEDGVCNNDINKAPFLFINDHPRKDYRGMAEMALKGRQTVSPLAELFFSVDNMKRLQKMLKREVLVRTKGKYKIVEQDYKSLFIVMQEVYYLFAKHQDCKINRQVKELNNHVIQEITPNIITNILQYYGYLKDINEPIKPINRPINVSHTGRKTLPSITTMWQN